MPDTSDRVMAMVEKELAANPNISNDELRAKAERLDASIVPLSARAFNARYPLQVKRRGKPRSRSGKKRGGKSAAGARKNAARASRDGGRKAGAARGGKGGRRRAARSGGTDERDRVRAVLLDLARDLTAADGAAGIVDVIGSVDDYVDRILTR